jgi:ATP-dependent RNA helicase DDX5/DBP2
MSWPDSYNPDDERSFTYRGKSDNSFCQSLESVDWSRENVEATRKDFYDEPLSVANRSEAEVRAFRERNNITVASRRPFNPILSFAESPYSQDIQRVFQDLNFSAPTPIQSQCWPIALSGSDLIGIASTGSGKTLAFLLPALLHIRGQPKLTTVGPQALVMAPTRELAQQIEQEFQRFRSDSSAVCLPQAASPCLASAAAPIKPVLRSVFSLKCVCVYGGSPKDYQRREIQSGAQLIIATPGRLIDFMKEGSINLKQVTFLVMDEADRMLDMGFEPQIRAIIGNIRKDRQTLMWSATWPTEVQTLAREFLIEPVYVKVGEELAANHRIAQFIELVTEDRKFETLQRVLKTMCTEGARILIFTETKRGCEQLCHQLTSQAFKVCAIHGDKAQVARNSALRDFKSGSVNVMVATDVAARGLDVKGVSCVVNFDFPGQIADYIHRIGRTARGGAKGTAISFFTPKNLRLATALIEVLEEAAQRVPEQLLRYRQSGSRVRSRSPARY